MAYPQRAAVATSNEPSNTTTHTITLPSGIVADSLVLVFVGTDGDISWYNLNGFTELFSTDNGTAASLSVMYKYCSGSEGSTVDFISNESEQSTHIAWRITGDAGSGTIPEVSTGNTGASQSPDPDSLTPTGGAKDYLWIAVEGNDDDDAASVFPLPDNNTTNIDSGGCGVSVCSDELNQATLDPSTFTITTEQWIACTVAVHPAAGTNYTLEANGGSYSLTGTATPLEHDKKIDLLTTSYSISGQALNTLYGRKVILGSGVYDVYSAPNILTDGGLEDWASDADLTYYTESISGSSTINKESTEIHGGSFSMRMDIDSSNNWASILQNQSLEQGKPHEIRLFHKFPSGGNRGAIRIKVVDGGSYYYQWSSGGWGTGTGDAYKLIAGADAWTEFAVEFMSYVGVSTHEITFVRWTAPNLSLYWDDISIRKQVGLFYNRKIQLLTTSYSLIGQDIDLLYSGGGYTLVADAGSYAITGQSLNPLYNRLVSLGPGSYAISGQILNLLYGRKVAIDSGVYSISGQTLDLLYGRTVLAESGTFSISGQTIDLRHNKIIGIGGTAYFVSGQTLDLLCDRIIAAAAGAYTLTGSDIDLIYSGAGYTLIASGGSYSISGQATNLLKDSKIPIDSGTYLVAGQAASLLRDAKITAEAGAYLITGQDAELLIDRIISALAGNYALTGQDAALLKGNVIALGGGTYTITGKDVDLIYTPSVFYPIIFDVDSRIRIFEVDARGRIKDVTPRDRVFDVKRRG